MRILLADDNPANEKAARKLLEQLGCVCETVQNGREVLDLLSRGEKFDCILMDMEMPEMDGLEASRLIHNRYPASSQRPPIIAVTANPIKNHREKCLAAGMVDFLERPLRLSTLRGALEKLGGNFAGGVPSVASPGDIDFDQFDSIINGGDEEAIAIFNDFCGETEQMLEEMQDLVNGGKARAFASLAHQLRGSFGTFGLAGLSASMAEYEESASSGSLAMIDQNWEVAVRRTFLETTRELQARIAWIRKSTP